MLPVKKTLGARPFFFYWLEGWLKKKLPDLLFFQPLAKKMGDAGAGAAAAAPDTSVTLKVTSQDGEAVFFKVSRKTPMRKLMSAYSGRTGAAADTLRFLFEGHRIADADTAETLDMDDGDIIDVVLQQTGGA